MVCAACGGEALIGTECLWLAKYKLSAGFCWLIDRLFNILLYFYNPKVFFINVRKDNFAVSQDEMPVALEACGILFLENLE